MQCGEDYDWIRVGDCVVAQCSACEAILLILPASVYQYLCDQPKGDQARTKISAAVAELSNRHKPRMFVTPLLGMIGTRDSVRQIRFMHESKPDQDEKT